MSRDVSIITYHYVRDLKRSRYPDIKGLDTQDFLGQMQHIVKNYNVITMEEVIQASNDTNHQLPEEAILLTFDDGYIDHYTTVFPILDQLGIQGAFYPSGRAIVENKVLDVNKIHFILACVNDKQRIVAALDNEIDQYRSEYNLKSIAQYKDTYAHANHWDPAEVIYVKRVLQRGLPELLRSKIVNTMFQQFVTRDEAAFSQELYTSAEQLKCMSRHGMHVGSHSYDHYWLDSLSPEKQTEQIELSIGFLHSLGCDTNNWTICYPHGGYDKSCTKILEEKNCSVGLTCRVSKASLDIDHPLELPRLDTTLLPYT